ncbi:MAG: hypothetical protein U0905_05245 [Pirellulales bacterium]
MAAHTIDLLEHALDVALRAGVRVRKDWLDGVSGGLCRVGKQHWFFLDLSQSAADQLQQLTKALRRVPLDGIELHPDLARLVRYRSKSEAS